VPTHSKCGKPACDSEDIPLLVEHFLKRFEKMYDKQIQGVSEKATAFMQSYAWPGNIRELENLLERAVLLTEAQQMIKLNALFPQKHEHDAEDVQDSTDLDRLVTEGFDLEQHEQQLIMTAMQKAKQNVSEAARLLGISLAALDYRLKKYAMR
jgi:transcriptional regulator with PAS, ATPase and Fis domain